MKYKVTHYAIVDPSTGTIWHIDEKRIFVRDELKEWRNRNAISKSMFKKFKVIPVEIKYEI